MEINPCGSVYFLCIGCLLAILASLVSRTLIFGVRCQKPFSALWNVQLGLELTGTMGWPPKSPLRAPVPFSALVLGKVFCDTARAVVFGFLWVKRTEAKTGDEMSTRQAHAGDGRETKSADRRNLVLQQGW